MSGHGTCWRWTWAGLLPEKKAAMNPGTRKSRVPGIWQFCWGYARLHRSGIPTKSRMS